MWMQIVTAPAIFPLAPIYANCMSELVPSALPCKSSGDVEAPSLLLPSPSLLICPPNMSLSLFPLLYLVGLGMWRHPCCSCHLCLLLKRTPTVCLKFLPSAVPCRSSGNVEALSLLLPPLPIAPIYAKHVSELVFFAVPCRSSGSVEAPSLLLQSLVESSISSWPL